MNNDVSIVTWNLVAQPEAGVKDEAAKDPKIQAIFNQHANHDSTIFVLQGNTKYVNEMFGQRDDYSCVETDDGIVFWNNKRFKPLHQTTEYGAHVHLEDSQTGRTIRVASINLTQPEPEQKEQASELRYTRLGKLVNTCFSNTKEDVQVIGMATKPKGLTDDHEHLLYDTVLSVLPKRIIDERFSVNSTIERTTFVYSRCKGKAVGVTSTPVQVEDGISKPILTTYTLSPTRFKKFCNSWIIRVICSIAQSIWSCIQCKRKEVDAVPSPQEQQGRPPNEVIVDFISYFCSKDQSGKSRLDTEGIFRNAGDSKLLDGLYLQLKEKKVSDIQFQRIDNAANLFKRYIYSLELIKDSSPYVKALQHKDQSSQIAAFKTLIQGMSTEKKALFQEIICFLGEVTNHKENKMTPTNLAIVFPGLFPTPIMKNFMGRKDNIATLQASAKMPKILEFIIENRGPLFDLSEQ